jgi:hypothetical protein
MVTTSVVQFLILKKKNLWLGLEIDWFFGFEKPFDFDKIFKN